MTRVKICGLTRRADAESAAAAGAAYLGVILAPGGRRSLPAEAAAEVLRGHRAACVGVFVNQPAAEVLGAAVTAGLDVLQLHGDETPGLLRELRSACDGELWKAVRPRSTSEFLRAVDVYAEHVDALLLDGWSAGAYGGTGTRFPWHEIARVRQALPAHVRLVAAGGLTPDNVADAVAALRPAVVDVSSGVESEPGVKDAERVLAFVRAVGAA